MINKVAERLLRIPRRRRGTGCTAKCSGGALRSDSGASTASGRSCGGHVERKVELSWGKSGSLFGQPHRASGDDAANYMGWLPRSTTLPGDATPAASSRGARWPEDRARHPQSPDADSALHEPDAAEIRRGAPRKTPCSECTQAILSEVNTLKHLATSSRARADAGPAPRGGDLPMEVRTGRGDVPQLHPVDPLGVPPGRPAAGLVRPVPDPARRHQPARQCRRRPRGPGVRHGHVHPRRDGGEGADRRCGRRAGDPVRWTATVSSSRIFRAGREGTGLGLAIVSAIANDHGGTAADAGQHAAGHRCSRWSSRPATGKPVHPVGGTGDRRRQAGEIDTGQVREIPRPSKIASGGMAEVYLLPAFGGARIPEVGSPLKVVHPRHADDPRFRELFSREARASPLPFPTQTSSRCSISAGGGRQLPRDGIRGRMESRTGDGAGAVDVHSRSPPGVWRHCGRRNLVVVYAYLPRERGGAPRRYPGGSDPGFDRHTARWKITDFRDLPRQRLGFLEWQ